MAPAASEWRPLAARGASWPPKAASVWDKIILIKLYPFQWNRKHAAQCECKQINVKLIPPGDGRQLNYLLPGWLAVVFCSI